MIDKKRNPIINKIEYMNNESKLEWLMEEYGQDVIMLAYTYTKQRHLSEDIAQEVFIKCYEKLESFRHESSYKTWIYRITINKSKDVLKSWSYKHIIFTDLFQTKKDNKAKSAELESINREEKMLIANKVMTLPIKLREVIILFYYQDLNINEIAELLDTKANTVKTRLHRARNSLERLIKGGEIYGR